MELKFKLHLVDNTKGGEPHRVVLSYGKSARPRKLCAHCGPRGG